VRRVLVDVNVILDAVLDRAPHAEAAARLWALAEAKGIEALVPAHGLTTIFYLLARERDAAAARRAVESIVATFGVASVDAAVIRRALALTWPDFEDAVCAGAADAAGCEVLVTRDPAGFPDSPVPVLDPPTAVALLSGEGPDRIAEGAAAYARPHRGRAPRRQQRRVKRHNSVEHFRSG
jgi:predicted nucleic acid-binding protein